MSRKGGYKIIDFRNIEIKETATEFTGIYDEIEGNFGKHLVFSGVNIGGIESGDIVPLVTVDESEYVACIGHTATTSGGSTVHKMRFIVVNDDDEVKYVDYNM